MNLNDFELNVNFRSEVGSSSVKKFLKKGQVPLVIYGKGVENLLGSINELELQKALKSKSLFNKFTKMNFNKEGKIESFHVVAKIVQKKSLNDKILHIDFQKVNPSDMVKMKIPVNFINKDICEEIKLGGMLNVVCHFIELIGLAKDMPEFLEYDLKNATSKTSIKTESLKFSDSVKPIQFYQNKVIATILAAKKKGSDEEAAKK